jgi:SHS2 domain-containing protein
MPTSSPDWLKEIDHTGDVGIRVRAASLPQLFERAAAGMFGVLTDLDSVRPQSRTEVAVEGRDREALLVRWLSELNFHHTTEHQLFSQFQVETLHEEDDGWHLRAAAEGEPVDRDRHTVYTEIKAVTFHGLEITSTDGEWSVQVIFDL